MSKTMNPLDRIRELIAADFGNIYERMESINEVINDSEGWVCVPVEPTEAMLIAGGAAGFWGYHFSSQSERKDDDGSTPEIYAAMLSASQHKDSANEQ